MLLWVGFVLSVLRADFAMTETKKRRTRSEMTAETIEALTSAARRHFATVGFGATSMDALCAEVGLTRGALYHHFGGKEGLLEEVVRRIHCEMGRRIKASWNEDAEPLDAFKGCCVSYLQLALEHEIQQIVLRDAPAVLGQRLREIDAEGSIAPITRALENLMALGRIAETDPEALARMIHGALVDAALWIAASEAPQCAFGAASKALEVLVDGLAKG